MQVSRFQSFKVKGNSKDNDKGKVNIPAQAKEA
jgi:hypothetical protein